MKASRRHYSHVHVANIPPGTIETLKQFKKDVTEIRKGTECGIGLANFSTIKAGDEIVTFNRVEVPRTL
jgi:translation initiation factor IF-2